MSFNPRYYQQNAHDAVIEAWRTSTNHVLVEAATGAGKSWIVSMIAKTVHAMSKGKRVLCLAPSKELIEQNSEKMGLLGEKFSIYSASISKSLRHPIVFATEGTFKSVAKRYGGEFAAVIIDEAHRTTPTIRQIIDDMKSSNSNLRVAGLTATPYVLGDGFIYGVDEKGRALSEIVTRDPYYHQLVYKIGARELIDQGFLTPVKIGDINAEKYDVSGLKIQSNGNFNNKSVEQAFTGWGRKTASIVADIVTQSEGKKGVMIFAATMKHAEEVMASLPSNISRLIGGKINMKKQERKTLVDDFKDQKFKYLVSVGTMTTGVDFTHVDVVAVLRATESISLLQQIIGRGLRLHDGKEYCFLLDYADNINRHCPDGDVFQPEIRAAYKSTDKTFLECECPSCAGVNVFSCRQNEMGLEFDVNGYFIDLDGQQVTVTDLEGSQSPLPAHYGRRCQHVDRFGNRCDYYWTSKQCAVCEHHNDIAARYCESCKTEIIDPNSKLIDVYTLHKKDPTKLQVEEILSLEHNHSVSRAGNEMVVLNFLTPRRKFTVYVRKGTAQFVWLNDATNDLTETPRTVTYVKDGDFWNLRGFNAPTDEETIKRELQNRGYTGEIPEVA